jgi:hypothetical protein
MVDHRIACPHNVLIETFISCYLQMQKDSTAARPTHHEVNTAAYPQMHLSLQSSPAFSLSHLVAPIVDDRGSPSHQSRLISLHPSEQPQNLATCLFLFSCNNELIMNWYETALLLHLNNTLTRSDTGDDEVSIEVNEDKNECLTV